jgi:hypothetical protein
MPTSDPKILDGNMSTSEREQRQDFAAKLRSSGIPDNEILANLALYLNRQELSRILFMSEIYRQIIPVHGVIMEFGVRWGRNLALFSNFRGMFEPFNYSRKLIGFDTFEGFVAVHEKDSAATRTEEVDSAWYAVTPEYEKELESILAFHEAASPLSHIPKNRLVKGDATKTLEAYLEEHPETIVALAYFDFDLYEPTKRCLELVADRLTKGSILCFDQLNYPQFPGETLALKEVLGLDRYAIRRSPLAPAQSYIVIE